MDKFKELVSLCKAGVHLSVNTHRDFYESVEQHITTEERQEIDADVFAEMVARDAVVEVHFYPDTPVGFFRIHHYDIDEAMQIALDVAKNNRAAQL